MAEFSLSALSSGTASGKSKQSDTVRHKDILLFYLVKSWQSVTTMTQPLCSVIVTSENTYIKAKNRIWGLTIMVHMICLWNCWCCTAISTYNSRAMISTQCPCQIIMLRKWISHLTLTRLSVSMWWKVRPHLTAKDVEISLQAVLLWGGNWSSLSRKLSKY